jgi:lysophospholipase L1-like esterase
VVSSLVGMLKRSPARGVVVLLAVGLASCGGGSAGPTSPSNSPTPGTPTYSVTATVFYDQNGNGQLDGNENARVPGVDVVIGTGTGRSAVGSGLAAVTGIQAGTLTVALRTESLPYYFQTVAPVTIQVPGTAEVRVPLQLQIGRNSPNLYLGLGDSITYGDGSSDGRGYQLRLQNLLGPHFGRAEVTTWGRQGDTSAETAEVTTKTLGWYNPAYTLILLGTNDWHDQSCQGRLPTSCYTLDSLREIVREVKAWDSLPVLGTIPPVNPARTPATRNTWYDGMNVGIKSLGQQERVLVADLNAEMKASGNLAALFADDVHPNDAGYQLMAQAWFKAITSGRASVSSAAAPRFGFRPF